MNEGEKQFGLVRYLAVVPFCGAIVAASYDVGYFFGFDISFYSFFSLSEHILFSLEAVPIALMLMLLFFGTAAAIGALARMIGHFIPVYADRYGYSHHKRIAEFGTRAAHWYFDLSSWQKLALWLAIASFEIVGSIGIWRLLDYLDANGHIIAVFIGSFVVFTFIALFSTGRLRSVLIVSAGAVACIFMSFVLGYASSQALKKDARVRQTLSLKSGPLVGKIVRSGERGVLVLRLGDGVLELVKWDQILTITSDQPNQGALGALLNGDKSRE